MPAVPANTRASEPLASEPVAVQPAVIQATPLAVDDAMPIGSAAPADIAAKSVVAAAPADLAAEPVVAAPAAARPAPRRAKRQGAVPIYASTAALFAGITAVLGVQMANGQDPGLGDGHKWAAAGPEHLLVRRVIVTKRVNIAGLTAKQAKKAGIKKIVIPGGKGGKSASVSLNSAAGQQLQVAAASPSGGAGTQIVQGAGGKPVVVAAPQSGGSAPVAAAPRAGGSAPAASAPAASAPAASAPAAAAPAAAAPAPAAAAPAPAAPAPAPAPAPAQTTTS